MIAGILAAIVDVSLLVPVNNGTDQAFSSRSASSLDAVSSDYNQTPYERTRLRHSISLASSIKSSPNAKRDAQIANGSDRVRQVIDLVTFRQIVQPLVARPSERRHQQSNQANSRAFPGQET